MHTYIIIAFAVYFVLLLTIGIVFHKKQKTSSDFILGNRSLNFWLVALSAHASDMSAWLFMAYPFAIFTLGLPYAWTAVGLLTGMFLNWHFIAPKLRSMTEQYHCYTLPSFFEKRFHDYSGKLRLVSAIAMTIFLCHYLSAGFIAMGNILEFLFGINYYIGISVAILVVVIYTFIGGFTTVAWTDLFQAIFLLIVILIVPYFAYQTIGGWHQIELMAAKKDIPLTFFSPDKMDSFVTAVSLVLGWGLGYFGMPHILTKFMGIKNTADMPKSKWLGMSWQLITLLAATAVGLIGIAFFPEGLSNPEMVFVEMVRTLFHPLVAGFMFCAIIAANMSTMDSQILVCGSIISEDLYKHYNRHRNHSDKKVLWASKLSVVGVALVGLLLAFNRSSTIADTVVYSWSGLGSAFGPVVLASLYSRKANKYGALAAIIVGTATVMLWPTLNPLLTEYEIFPMVPGFILSFLALLTVSSWTAKEEETSNARI